MSGIALTEPQERLMGRLEESEKGWVFISGAEVRVAYALRDLGLANLGSRHHETGMTCPPWTKGWCHTAELVS